MLIEPFVEYEFDLSGTFSFGAIGSVDLDHCFYSISHTFPFHCKVCNFIIQFYGLRFDEN